MPGHEKLQDFMNYLTENYIVFEAKFPMSMWEKMKSSSERITNACESFHSKFNLFFLKTYLYIFRNIKKKFKLTLKLQSNQPQKQL
jgi:hypothetical protein